MDRPRPLPSVFRDASPRKPLHQLVGGDIQRGGGDVAEGDGHLVLSRLTGEVDPGPRLGVLVNVAQQVLKHPPQQPPVGGNGRVLRGGGEDQVHPLGRQIFPGIPRRSG